MKLLRLLGLAPLATLSFVVPPATAAVEDPAVAAVIATERARGTAMLAADLKALAGILADDFRYTHSNGKVETKASHIGTYEAGLRYARFNVTQLTGHVVTPDVVVLNGLFDQSKGTDGKMADARLLFQAVWRKKGGAWQIVSLQTAKAP